MKHPPRFKSDYAKVIERAGAKLGQRLTNAFEDLKKAMQSGQRLPKRFKEHPLRGERAGKWEVHLLHRGSDYLVEYIKTVENGKMIYTLTRFTKHDRLNAMRQAMVERLNEFSPEDQDILVKLCEKYGIN